jgi:4'-phosphopantetheinyl transferase
VRAALPDLLGLLPPQERARHEAFRQQDDQERFLLGRAVLRQMLGSWLERDPRRLVLNAGLHGKPELSVEHGPAGPAFNVAHSGDLVVLAFHAASPVGVDVEQSRPQLAWRPIARRVLPPATVEWLEQLPAPQRRETFLQQWCLLEASLKARGTGFASVGAQAGARAPGEQGLERLEPMVEQLVEQRLWCLALPAGYCGAVSLLGGP